MKKLMLTAALLAGCAMLAFGQADRRPALGILPFTGGAGDDGEAIANLISMQPAILNAFAVVPRTAELNALFAEHYVQLAGLTDSDTIASIGRALNADYMLSGSIRRLGHGNLFLATIVNVETFEQLGGYRRAFQAIEEVLGFLPSMSRSMVDATLGRDASGLPSLAMLPLSIAAGVDPQDAETLSMILAIEILNAGEHVLLPRASTVQAALAGTDLRLPGYADAAGMVALGRALDADFVLSGEINRLGALNVLAARVLRVADGVPVAGATWNFAIADGVYAMANIAGLLTGGDARASDQVAVQREVRPARERRETVAGDVPAHWASLQLGFPWPAAAIRYERRLTGSFALGAMLFEGPHLDDGSFGGLAATARYFPLRWLYLELGAGLGWLWEDGEIGSVDEWGFGLVPSIGARFTLGQMGGFFDGLFAGQQGDFFINPFVSVPLVFSDSGVTPSVWGGIGFGWAWGGVATADQVAGRAPREPRDREARVGTRSIGGGFMFNTGQGINTGITTAAEGDGGGGVWNNGNSHTIMPASASYPNNPSHYSFGGWFFTSTRHFEFSLGVLGGNMNGHSDSVWNRNPDESWTRREFEVNSVFTLSLGFNWRIPFDVHDRVTVFPIFGVGLDVMSMIEVAEHDEFLDSLALGVIRVNLGGGADFDISERTFIRLQLLGHFGMPHGSIYHIIRGSHYRYPTFMFGFTPRIAVGFRW